MPLPKLETPTYELVLPSTNKKIKYRPFLVKEYKILLTSMDADADELSRVVKELIDVCTFNKIKIDKLTHFDIEYLFLQIRAKSISEISKIIVNCDCGEKIPYNLDITKAIIENKENTNTKIIIDKDIGVEMRFPTFEEILELYENQNTENAIQIVKNCVEAVFTKDDYTDRTGFTEEELEEFLNSFSKSQFDKLENFFSSRPKVVQIVETTCPACSTVNKVRIEGIENFFV